DAGEVHVDAAPIGMLFQNNALFDFMTVGDNVAFPLVRQAKLPADEIRARVAERLRAVGLAGSEDKLPNELSGGMKKRAALARAVISSDVEALRAFCPRVAMLHDGALRYDGAASAIADSDDAVVRQFVRGALEGPL